MTRISVLLGRKIDIQDPEGVAEALSECSGTGSKFPVDLETIVSLWPGLRVTYTDITNSGYLIALSDRNGEIVIRQNDHLVRRRFSLAHELGHWVIGDSYGVESAEPIGGIAVESWCDRFANRLLMPESAIDAFVGFPDSAALATQRIGKAPLAFMVSHEAVFLRLCRDRNVRALVFATKDKIIGAFYSSCNGRLKRTVMSLCKALQQNPGNAGTIHQVMGVTISSALVENPNLSRKELVVAAFGGEPPFSGRRPA